MVNRVFWLDAVRAIAIILVVFTHTHENIQIESVTLRSVFYSIDRLGVPLFFMISGGLILPKLSNYNLLTFYKKRIPQFIILLIFWSIITNSVMYYINGLNLLEALKKSIINNNGIRPSDTGGAIQMWFLYSIIQLYLIAPFLAKILNNSSNKEIFIFLIFCIIFNQFNQSINIGFLYRLGTDLTGPYITFFIIGYLIIHKNIWCSNSIGCFLAYTLITLIPIILLIKIDYNRGSITNKYHWYSTSLFILISSVGLLLIIKWLFENIKVPILTFISKCSFGIYLTHYMFIYIAKGIIKTYSLNIPNIGIMIIYFIFSFFTSMMLTSFLMKMKITRYLVT